MPPTMTAARGVLAAVALLALMLSCQPSQAAPSKQDGDDTGSQGAAVVVPTKPPPGPSTCTKLVEPLRSLTVEEAATRASYPFSLDIENGKVWINVAYLLTCA